MEIILNQDIIDLLASEFLIIAKTSKRLYDIWKENNIIYYDNAQLLDSENKHGYNHIDSIETIKKVEKLGRLGKRTAPKYLYIRSFLSLGYLDTSLKPYLKIEYLLIDNYYVSSVILTKLVGMLPLKKMVISRSAGFPLFDSRLPFKIENIYGDELYAAREAIHMDSLETTYLIKK